MTYLLNWTNCLWNGLSWFDGNSTSYNTTTSGSCGSTTYNGNDCGFLSGGSHNTSLDVNFDSCLKDISFDLFDISLSNCGPGKLCDIKFTDVLGNIVDAKYELINGVVKVVCDVPSTGFTLFNCSKDYNHDIKFGSISCSPAPEYNLDGEGVVEGTEDADLIDYNYTGDPDGDKVDHNDALLQGEVGDDDIIVSGAGNDTIYAGAGNDEIYAGAGDDIATGGAGDDVIYGDSTLGNFATGEIVTTGPRESFEWDKAPDPGLFNDGHIDDGDAIGNFSQNTGSVNVSFSKTYSSGSPETTYTAQGQLTSDIDDGAETIDSTSGLKSYMNSNGETAGYKLNFSNEVYNVDFRINDIDTDSNVLIRAYDADGNEVDVNFTVGSDISVSNHDGLNGDDLLTSINDADQSPTTASTSALVEIQGPVARIEIYHSQVGSLGSGVLITDVYYDTGTPIAVDPATLVGGNDTLSGGLGDDTIFGETGDDSISGGKGEDLLFGGEGSDSISGGDDNDTIYGDEISSSPSDGNFIVNGSFENVSGLTQTDYGYVGDGAIAGWTSTSAVNDMDVHNDGRDGIVATDGQHWLDLDASPGNIRVGQDVQGLTDGQTYELSFDVNDTPNKTSVDGPEENTVKVYWNGELIATIDPLNANGDTTWDHYTFQLTAGSGNGTNRLEFQGAGNEDNYGVALDNIKLVSLDGSMPSEDCGDDTIDGGAGDDLIFGNGGDDSITGGLGNDTIYGDSGDTLNTTPVVESYVRESFEWNLADDPNGSNPIDNGDNLAGGFTQDTGRVSVTFEATTENGTPVSTFANNQQKVHSVDTGSETIDPYSSLSSELDANGEKVTYSLDFSDEVRDVSFRVNDIDFNSKVVIKAYDANGNLVAIDVQAGSNINVQDLDGVGGTETLISSQAMSGEDTDPNLSGLINIAGPIVRLEIIHEQVGTHNSGINITDVYYDAPVYSDVPAEECAPGDDILEGAEGNDVIYGNAGNDTITGGADADTLYGGDDRDTFIGGTAGDVVDGGTDGDDFDTLDLRNAGAVRIVNQTVDADGDSTSGTVEFLDVHGNVVDTMEFSEIERILLPENDAPEAIADFIETPEDVPFMSFDPLANDIDPNGDELTLVGTPTALHGTVTVNPDGTINYHPDENYNGTDTITYTIRDEEGLTSTTTVTVTVTPVNDAPVAGDDSASTDEETPVTIDVLENDTDVDGDDLTISEEPGEAPTAEHGTVEVVDGQLVYTPEDGYTGTDTITYTVSDGNGGTDTATVTVNVSNVNDAPVANPDMDETPEDTPVTIDVLENDTDEDGDTLTISEELGEAPTALHGTVEVVDGQLVYTPDENYNGTDTITYTIRDEEGLTSTTTVTVTVTPVNDAPVAGDDSASTDEETPVTIDVLENDTDVDGDDLTISEEPGEAPTAEHGTVEVVDGQLVYTPEDGYTGTDTITYTVSDGNGGTDTATVTVNVTSKENIDPEACNDVTSTGEDTPVVIKVLENDHDENGDQLTVIDVSEPQHGEVIVNLDGTVTYTPDEGYTGTDSFTYTVSDGNGGTDTATVTVNVEHVNTVDAVDDSATTDEGTPVIIDVLANDSDPEQDAFDLSAINTLPGHGTLSNGPDGKLVYTPDAGYTGTDSFTYTITDENGATDTATVTINVTEGEPDNTVEAVDDSATTDEGTPVTIDLLGNDIDTEGDAFELSAINTLPEHGMLSKGPNGTLVYTPDEGYTGTDSFTYTITDEHGATDTATVTINVTEGEPDNTVDAVDDMAYTPFETPVIIDALANDTDEEGDTFTITDFTQPLNGTVVKNLDGTFTYTPNDDYMGTDTFTYTVTDAKGATDTATVTVSTGEDPYGVPDEGITYEDKPITIDVLANDLDDEEGPLDVVEDSVTDPAHGTAVLNEDGTVTYTPDEGFTGTDTFEYTVVDQHGNTDTATVTVNVLPNTAPEAVDDADDTFQEVPVIIDVLGNDTDEDGDTLSVVPNSLSTPSHGTVVLNPDGTVTYTPEAGYAGTDTFTYTIVDEDGLTDTATVTVTVAPDTDPVAVDDQDTTYLEKPIVMDLLANDTDEDGDELSIVPNSLSDPANGTVTLNPDGTVTYTPDTGFTGTDTFVYTITDEDVNTDTAQVTVDVLADTNPIAVDDVESTHQDQPVTIDVLGNDTDEDGDTLTVVPNSATDPAHGSVVIQPDGTIVYTPDTGYTGTDTFSYTVTDDDGNTDVAEVTVTIVPGTAPDAVDDAASTYPNRPVVIDVLDNDEDADGDTLSVVPNSLSDPEHGTVTLNPDGTVTYTPDEDYVGTDTFTYVVTDDDGSTDLATVTVTVQENTAPDAVDDVRTVDQGNPITIDVLANDTDEDGDTLNILENTVTQPLHGTVAVNPDGTIVYTPEAGYTGTDSFEYTIVDEEGLTDTATVSINVEDTNVAPDAVDDNSTTPMDAPVIIEVLANDTDPNSDPLTVTSVTDPAHGTVVINPDGTLTYTPDAGFTGTDTFDYTISDGRGGSDTATVNLTIPLEPTPDGTVEGTAGDDLIDLAYTGDPDGDMIDNNDAILPGDVADDDLVYGYDGDDTILAGEGDDEVYGGDGDDTIDTSSSELRPDLGYPGLWSADNDPLDDLDTVYGGDGNDTITTGDDADSIDGGAGDDFIDAGVDADTIDGGDGNDTIIGGEGDDTIDGGKGDDLIYGGLDDSFPDFINIPNVDGDAVTNNGRDVIDAGEGNDTVYGEDDDDTIFGGLGNDLLDGGIDDDEIYGGDGTDTIIGGEGEDDLFGGFGSDTFLGGTGGDIVVGGEDPDDRDIDVLDLRGSAVDFITYDQNDPEKGVVTFLDGSTMNFSEIENVIPCFTPGTTIATPQGERLVEELRVGDRVITRDNGIQEIAWVGQKELSLGQLEQSPHLKPVLIKAGSLGNGLPERDMIVSPNHRVLVASDLTQLYFEEREVLAAAKHLVGSQGIINVEQPKTTYIHFMFERHEVVLSNGSWTESFQPGDYSLKGIGNGSREEIFELFPELRTREGIKDYNSARRALKRHEAKLLINK